MLLFEDAPPVESEPLASGEVEETGIE